MDELSRRVKATPRELITALPEGGTVLMHNGATVGAQVGRQGDVYYVCGPEFQEWGIDLDVLLAMPEYEAAVDEVNGMIAIDFPSAQIFVCEGLDDAIQTLDSLFTAIKPWPYG